MDYLQREDDDNVWWFSPHISVVDFDVDSGIKIRVGEIHRVEVKIYSRSPLCLFLVIVVSIYLLYVGEITQERRCYKLSFSPLLIFVLPSHEPVLFFQMSGRLHRVVNMSTLVLPSVFFSPQF